MSKETEVKNSGSFFKRNRRALCISGSVVGVLVVVAVVLGIILPGKLASSNSVMQFNVGQLSSRSGSSALQRRADPTGYSPNDAVRASGTGSWAFIDAMELTAKAMRIASNKGQRRDYLFNWGSGKPLTLGPGVQSITINDSVNINTIQNPFTTQYLGLDLITATPFSLKAFCKTSTKFVYTTANGVVAVDVNTVTNTKPADYDYFNYSAPMTSSPDGSIYSNQFNPFTITYNLTTVTVYVENSYIVKCWDGVGLNPFGLSTTGPQFNFFGQLTYFVQLSTSQATQKLTPESYVVSQNQSDISGSSINWNNAQVVTFAFLLDGTIFGAMTANSFLFNTATGLLGPSNFVTETDGSISFSDGTQYGIEYRNVKDRVVVGFRRAASPNTIVSTTMADGSECGMNMLDFSGNNAARTCLGSGVTVVHYWKKVSRG